MAHDDSFESGITADVEGVLSERFYTQSEKPTHYKVICISMYTKDLERLDALVDRAQEARAHEGEPQRAHSRGARSGRSRPRPARDLIADQKVFMSSGSGAVTASGARVIG